MFQGFHRRIHGVGHMGMDCGDAGAARSRPHAAADGFVVGVLPDCSAVDAADGDIVHRAALAAGIFAGLACASAPNF